jgi:type IV secretion system protein VirB4
LFKASATKFEREPDTYIPYVGHVTRDVVMLDDGALLAMLHVRGMAFEMADVGEINGRHAQRNILLRNIASDRLVVSSHVVRIMETNSSYPEVKCHSAFAQELDAAYSKSLLSNRLYRNELYYSVLLRPSVGGMVGIASLIPRNRGKVNRVASNRDTELINNVLEILAHDLAPYGARILGTRGKGCVTFSEPAEALRLILTGQPMSVPLVSGHLGGAIYTDRVIVGRETIEIRGAGASTYAACFGMREYPASTWPGLFDSVLAAPYSCVLTQSFGFLSKQSAQTIMTRKQNQMTTGQDKAASQAEALTEAADLLASNAFVMGDHHLTLVTFANSIEALRAVASSARRDLAESGAVIVREDLGLEAAYWAQLPGNLKYRPRPGAISSRNFSAMASLHNDPGGVMRGHWGPPLTIFRSSGGTSFRFHLHAPTDAVTDLGNLFLAGPSGSGKTTLMLFLLAMAERQDAQIVFFDKDRGGEIFARAVGGTYLVLPSGAPTGLAPLKALSDTPINVEFLKQLVVGLIALPGAGLSPDEERRLELGIKAVLSLPKEARSLRELRAFLGQGAQGPGARLEKWCQGGSLGWVLDNETDRVALDAPFLGFDTTAVLDDAVTRGPILSYLFHRVESLLDGRRIVLAIDEFWKVLLDEGFRDLVNNKLKTIRKENGLIILATQSPADALRSPIAHSIIEQCPTQILLPNTRASEHDYRGGLKLTEAEFRAVKEELTGGRRFLLKQGTQSVACELDLTGMEDLVAVLSGRAGTVRLMERLIAEHGDRPEAWLPQFRNQWHGAAT